MKIFRQILYSSTLVLITSCSNKSKSDSISRIQELSEKTGIEMIVIEEAEKITRVEATHFMRKISLALYTDDPIQSTTRQEVPKSNTVYLPGLSFLIDHKEIEQVVLQLNQRLGYRHALAFISNDDSRSDTKQTISIIQTEDKYNALRLQNTEGGSYNFSTDSLIYKLQRFEEKYPLHFIGVGDDWLLIKTDSVPSDWLDFAKEVLKVCPLEEQVDIDQYADEISRTAGRVSMWWD